MNEAARMMAMLAKLQKQDELLHRALEWIEAKLDEYEGEPDRAGENNGKQLACDIIFELGTGLEAYVARKKMELDL